MLIELLWKCKRDDWQALKKLLSQVLQEWLGLCHLEKKEKLFQVEETAGVKLQIDTFTKQRST